jgi:DNA ligase-1
MNSQDIAAALNEIAATSGKNAKAELIRKYGADRAFLRVVRAALDTFITYGISKMPADEAGSYGRSDVFDESTWLLLDRLAKRELTGNAARSAVAAELGSLMGASADLLEKILKKDLRAGFSADTVNRLFPGTIPTFDCMLAHPFEAKRLEGQAFVEPKVDGWRTLAVVDLGASTPTATFLTRSGKEIGTLEHLKAPLIKALLEGDPNYGGSLVVDGEVVSGTFNETASSLQRKKEQAIDASMIVFDVLTKTEWDEPNAEDYLRAPEYHARRKRLTVFQTATPTELARGLGSGRIVCMPSFQAVTEEDIHELYERFRSYGLEGAIVKPANGRYRKARDYGWMKLKAEQTLDLPVVGAYPGEAGKQFEHTAGGIVVDFEGVHVHVGGGFTVGARDEIWAAWLEDQQGVEPFKLVDQIAEVLFHEKTPDGSLRHPRFVRFRADK